MASTTGLICLDKVGESKLQDGTRNPDGMGVLEALLEHLVMNVGIER